eukprot:SAG22_NODE_3977_length_1441_cov_1.543964_2_plen_122_part_01
MFTAARSCHDLPQLEKAHFHGKRIAVPFVEENKPLWMVLFYSSETKYAVGTRNGGCGDVRKTSARFAKDDTIIEHFSETLSEWNNAARHLAALNKLPPNESSKFIKGWQVQSYADRTVRLGV